MALTEKEIETIKNSYRDALLVRDALHMGLSQAGMTLTPLTLLLAAVQEFYETSKAYGDLPATKEEFVAMCASMATAVAGAQFVMAEVLATMPADAFNEVPANAFVVPGPSEPQ
jgi:hypothetical protein